MKLNKSQHLQLASWKPKKVDDIIQFKGPQILANRRIWSFTLNMKIEDRRIWIYYINVSDWNIDFSLNIKARNKNKGSGKGQYPNSKTVRQEDFPLTQWGLLFFFFSYLGLQLIRSGPPTLGRAICFTQFTDSNVNKVQSHGLLKLEVIWSSPFI